MSLQVEVYATLITLLLIQSASAASYAQFHKFQSDPQTFSAEEQFRKAADRLTKPLIGDDGRVYTCSQKNFLAFHSNGSIAWSITLNYTCSINIAPVHGGSRKIYLVAENRVLRINPLNIGRPEPAVEEFFGPEPGEIIGLAVSISGSCVIINVKRRGLFAYRLHGRLVWSAGPVLYQHGYRQGCRKNVTECYFSSDPVIDHCEASIYISNTAGELYSLSVRTPHFKWIQDFSSFGIKFTVIPANNVQLYVILPGRALLLALDVSTGNILWQRSIGPVSSEDYVPAVDSNGWISIGSLDGYLYTFSPTGVLKKFQNLANVESVIQVSPVVDCSGYAVYVSQTQMDGKVGHTIGDYTYISALRPKSVLFTMLVPATGSIYWSETHPPGQFIAKVSQGDLQHFKLDENVILSFLAASSIGNPLPCRSTYQKFASSCSLARTKKINIYTGNEKAILLFLLFESALMIILAVLVRFCCIFWRKRKLQSQGLGKFLETRHSLRLQKKAFDRTITELEQKAAEEAVANDVLEKLGNLVKEREGIERKLSTTYSLGRDQAGSRPKALLPVYDGKTRSYSFQGAKRESVTIFHTLSDTSSDGISEQGTDEDLLEEKELTIKGKGKAPIEEQSCSDEEIYGKEHGFSTSCSASSWRVYENPLFIGNSSDKIKEERRIDEGAKMENMQNGSRRMRRNLSSTN